LHLRDTVGSRVLHNHFIGNMSGLDEGRGGGLVMDTMESGSADATIDANLFLDNRASSNPAGDSDSGGGEFLWIDGDFSFTNNVVADNQASNAGGISLDLINNPLLINNTFVNNTDIGILVGEGNTPDVTLINNIVVSHTVGISVTEGVTATVRYTLWDANGTDIAGGGTISHTHPVTGAPDFADPAGHDYHLTGSSAAIDAGDPAGVPPAPPQDYDGVTRPQNLRVDLGAYEWRGSRLFFPLMYKNWRPQIGWVVGASVGDGYGVILGTNDGGQTWKRQGKTGEIPDMDLECIAAIDAQNAWVVGGEYGSGLILRTRDGGETWEQQEIPEDAQGNELMGIFALDNDTAWAVGFGSVILHTTNGGATWVRQGQVQIPEVPYYSVYASDRRHVWVIGDLQNPGDKFATVVRSGTWGIHWKEVPYSLARELSQGGLIMVHGVDANTVWIVGPGQVSHTADGGKTWIDQWRPDMSNLHMNGVFALDRNYIWLARDQGGIFLSTDGGSNFQKQETHPEVQGDEVLRISATDRKHAWAVTTFFGGEKTGHVLHTADGGQTWITQTTPVKTRWSWVSFVR